MIQRHSVKLGNSEKVTAGPLVEGVFLRIEGRGSGALVIEMNEYLAADIVEALQPLGRKRP